MGSDMEKLDTLLQTLEKNEARCKNYVKYILQVHGEIEKLDLEKGERNTRSELIMIIPKFNGLKDPQA